MTIHVDNHDLLTHPIVYQFICIADYGYVGGTKEADGIIHMNVNIADNNVIQHNSISRFDGWGWIAFLAY